MMIRFKTIEPEPAAKPAKAPAAAAPAAPPREQAQPIEGEATDEAKPSATTPGATKPKGLARKTPLRAKKPETARLFEG
jgi:hypothetical protein